MTDPIRLRDPRSGATPELRELLAAGRSEMPSAERLGAIAGRLGLLPSGAPGAVDALTRGTGKWLGAGTTKVGAAVLLLGVGTAVVAARSRPAPIPSEHLPAAATTTVRALPVTPVSADVAETPELPTTTFAVPAKQPSHPGRSRATPAMPAAATAVAPASGAATSHPARDWAPSTWGSSVSPAPAAPAASDTIDPVQRAERDLDLALRDERSVGGLVEERDAVIIEALVRLGRMDEARQRAARFFRVFPGSARRRELAELVGFDPGLQNP